MESAASIRQLLIGHGATLLAGGLIYVFFRTTSLRMFAWLDWLGLTDFIVKSRAIVSFKSGGFVLFALPDGLWLFSYLSLMLYIWKNKIDGSNLGWLCAVPVLAIASEFGQFTGVVPGTFDVADVLMYLAASVLPFVIYRKSITFKPIQT